MRVEDLEDLFTAAETLTCLKRVAGNELLIVTNGGGAGVLAVDDLVQTGGSLAKLTDDLIAELDAILPATWSRANPIDIIGDATPDRYAATMDAVIEGAHANAILVINCPTALASSADAAEAVIGAVDRHKHDSGVQPRSSPTGLAPTLLPAPKSSSRRRAFRLMKSRRDAIKGFGFLWQYTKAQASLMRTPPREADLSGIDREAALQSHAGGAARAGRALLTEPEAKAVLAAYGIPTVPTSVAASPEEVEEIAFAQLKQAPNPRHQGAVGGHLAQIRCGRRAARARLPCRSARGGRGDERLAWRRRGQMLGSKASPCSR